MQIKRYNIWFTLFTLVALMLSGVSGNAALMPMHLTTDHQMMMSAEPENSHCISAQEMSVTENHHQQNHCDTDSNLYEHQCCYSGCIASYTMLASPVFLISQPFRLALISPQPVQHVSTIASALFRPPIA